jgi:hypothetical protein
LDKITYYEVFLRLFDELETEQHRLLEQLHRGRNFRVLAQQMADLEVRINQTEFIYQKLKGWF